MMSAGAGLVIVALALVASASVRPWRLLRGGALATPLLATLTVLPWLWSWPGLVALPLPLQWSAAPIAVLMLGWPLAIPVLVLSGLSTMLTTGATLENALTLTVWSGVLPATLVMALGHLVRRATGAHPVGYILGRAFLVPLAALVACSLAAAFLGHGFTSVRGEMHAVAMLLLAMGEASWTCAIASLLVAYRPEWLATWSDSLYLGRPARAAAPVRTRT
jgi:uncharacterized membrane protein